MEAAPRQRALRLLGAGALALLLLFTLRLSLTRLYQVDEAQNVFMAKVTAMGTQERFYSNGSLFLLGPLAWIAGHATTSQAMYTGMRLLFFGLYWLNIALIPLAAGLRLRSLSFLWAVVLTGMLAPLVDYGLQVRHDNVLLTWLLLTWIVVRRFRGSPRVGWALLGVLCGIMQFTAFKSFLYWMPLVAVVLAWPPEALRTGRFARVVAWAGGLALAVVAARLAYGLSGAWGAYVAGLQTAFGHSSEAARFTPWKALGRLLHQAPFLLGLGLAVAVRALQSLRDGAWRARGWEGSGPEAALFLLVTAALFANPVPYPYNLLYWVPFLVLWLLRAQSDEGVEAIPPALVGRAAWPLLAGALLFAHVVPSVDADWRHLSYTNARQHLLMATAEALTDPAKDRVFDGAGLVASRESVGYQWFVHSLVLDGFRSDKQAALTAQLEAHPPAVILRSYRTDWMGAVLQEFVRRNYIGLADDLFVLGTELPAGGGSFAALQGGRYSIGLRGADKRPVRAGEILLDGAPIADGSVHELAAGPHRLAGPEAAGLQVAWTGPRLPAPPTLPKADHRDLFVSWY